MFGIGIPKTSLFQGDGPLFSV